ncbi:hypothetical protein HAX54_044450, partial [Datura stramonium]|nr:hypothetical protein [Datura stramonium]
FSVCSTGRTQVKTREAPISRRSFTVDWGHSGHLAPHQHFTSLDPWSTGEMR